MVPPTTRINPAINTKGMKPELLPSIATSAANSSGSLETGGTGCTFTSSLVFGSMTVGIADTSDTDMLPAANTKASRGESSPVAIASGIGLCSQCRAMGSHKQFQYGPYKQGRSEPDHCVM